MLIHIKCRGQVGDRCNACVLANWSELQGPCGGSHTQVNTTCANNYHLESSDVGATRRKGGHMITENRVDSIGGVLRISK